MVKIESFIHVGYALLVLSLVLMLWASWAGARDFEVGKYTPCSFNPLCTCSKAYPDVGVVSCTNVPFPTIPKMINISKAFVLHMENTGLRELEPYFLQATGLYRIEISHNPLTDIPEHAFMGLERSLWELVIRHTELVEIPPRAFRYLQKLRLLDLSGNQISCIKVDSFRGLEDSLQTLSLAENSIAVIPQDCFTRLSNLDTIDLSDNNLAEIDPNVFRDGMPKLSKLILADNVLNDIPYYAIATLKSLHTLDLSYNNIRTILPEGLFVHDSGMMPKLKLDVLNLGFNRIEELPTASFSHFDIVNVTYLDGNPIYILEDEAFRPAQMRELYIRFCGLTVISPNVFEGMPSTLQVLDLTGNNLTTLPSNFLKRFDDFKTLILRDNKIKSFQLIIELSTLDLTLQTFDFAGEQNPPINLQDLRKMRNIRQLTLGRLSTTKIGPEDFVEYGNELEDLELTFSSLDIIKSSAFKNVRGIKRLDLSENRIGTIEYNAFAEIGHSLITLKIAHGLSTSLQEFPAQSFHGLTELRDLDISNNNIKVISETNFHFLHNLHILQLNDNNIERILKGTFQGDIHSKLEVIILSFNKIKEIQQHTFVDLKALSKLILNDNRITTIERRAFMNLNQLKHLSLRGNKLSLISNEAFQNLPELEHLDLSYNQLHNLDFSICDQVGTLGSLRINASFNHILELTVNQSATSNMGRYNHGTMYHSNIKILDLSHNNISRIEGGFFQPAEISLTYVYLAHNQLRNVSRDIFGNMHHLQWLDLSHNLIDRVEFDCFINARRLQVLYMSNNFIFEIPSELFRMNSDMRILRLSHNSIRNLPDGLFVHEGIEILDVSNNLLTKIPVMSLTNLAALSVYELDLSYNSIGAIHSMDLSNKFRSLFVLNLSNNHLFRLDDASFATLPRLSVLDLSNNNELEVMDKAFLGLQNSLLKLKLDNVSLTTVPEMSLPYLRELHLSRNELPSIPQELGQNLSSLRVLDLSLNDLTSVPMIANVLPQLKSLSLASNSISALTNTTFLGIADRIEHLDISNLNLHLFETGALSRSKTLRSLRLSPYPHIPEFNIPKIMSELDNVRHLWIDAAQPPKILSTLAPVAFEPDPVYSSNLQTEMSGPFPIKLRSVTVSGQGFNTISDNILKGIKSKTLHFSLHNTSIANIPERIFHQLGEVANISIDIRFGNRALSKIPNPNSAQQSSVFGKVYLTDLRMAGITLTCDCGIGWIEFWQRKRRQNHCRTQSWEENGFTSPIHVIPDKFEHSDKECSFDDDFMESDIRDVFCSNRPDNLIEAFKTDLECGWNHSSPLALDQNQLISVLAFSILAVLFGVWF